MRFPLVPKSMAYNDLERHNGPYFQLFHRIHVQCRRKNNYLGFKSILIVYDRINTISAAIIQRLLGQNKL